MRPPWERPLTLASDLAPVLVLILVGIITAPDGRANPLLGAIVAAPLVLRRLAPFPVLVSVALLSVVTSLRTDTTWVQIGAMAVASYTTGASIGDRTRSALGVIAIAALMTFGFLLQDADPLQAIVLPFVVVVPTWLVGDVIRARRVESLRHAEAAERALQKAEERVLKAAADERRHMARELHDVVAHGVSVMVIQTGAARQVLETSPDRARDSLLTVEATGRTVMAELRRLLGVLNDEGEATALAPQPGIDEIDALVERVRAAGLPAELAIDGTPSALPASLDVTAYRIVQEALTNALRYAKRAATLVHVSYEPGQLRLEILDDGPGTAAEPGEGSGRGLAGMQERASLVGGRLEAGPRLGGGYAVRAWLPFKPEQP